MSSNYVFDSSSDLFEMNPDMFDPSVKFSSKTSPTVKFSPVSTSSKINLAGVYTISIIGLILAIAGIILAALAYSNSLNSSSASVIVTIPGPQTTVIVTNSFSQAQTQILSSIANNEFINSNLQTVNNNGFSDGQFSTQLGNMIAETLNLTSVSSSLQALPTTLSISGSGNKSTTVTNQGISTLNGTLKKASFTPAGVFLSENSDPDMSSSTTSININNLPLSVKNSLAIGNIAVSSTAGTIATNPPLPVSGNLLQLQPLVYGTVYQNTSDYDQLVSLYFYISTDSGGSFGKNVSLYLGASATPSNLVTFLISFHDANNFYVTQVIPLKVPTGFYYQISMQSGLGGAEVGALVQPF